LRVHPPTFVPLSAEDEKRAMAAFAELLAPLFDEAGNYGRKTRSRTARTERTP
jgi:hypothetical protein